MRDCSLRALLITTLVISGCAVGPDYVPPHAPTPSDWHESLPKTKILSVQPQGQPAWWTDFEDEDMINLIDRGLAHNEDLATAAARILEARGLRESAVGALFPQIGGDVQASRGDPGVPTTNSILTAYQGSFDASWEIDLFGGTRRKIEAQNASIDFAKAAYQNASLSLAAEIARDYILLRQYQAQLEVTRETADLQHHLFEITKDRYKGGLVSTLDVAQAETLFKTTSARLPDYERQIKATSYRLSILLGETPGSVSDIVEHQKPIPAPARLPALDEPADIIAKRPDVTEAERALAGATALQGVALSALYPKISLSALFGMQYGSLPVFEYAATHHIWNLAGDVTMPILNFGSIEGQINAADARQVEAFHQYQQTVLEALGDVETDLSNLSHEMNRESQLEQAAQSAKRAVDVARDRYRSGLADFTTVIQAEQQRFSVQIDLMTSRSTVSQNAITLHKALGEFPTFLASYQNN